MDLGFGGFLERFEDHFGRAATKALLVVIGVTIVSLCGATIWAYLLKPVAEALPDPSPGGNLAMFAKVTVFALVLLWLLNALLDLVDNYLKRRGRKRLREAVERAERLMEELNETRAETLALHREVGENNAASELILQEAMRTALARELITPEQAAELRNLLDRPLTSEDDQASA